MAIECESCGEQKWCIRDDGEWVCKDCFLESGGDIQEWNEINDEAKRKREEKRIAVASEEFDDFTPYKAKAKKCKYGCGMMIFWDSNSTEKNKFVESESGMSHSYRRCAELLKEQNKDVKVLDKK